MARITAAGLLYPEKAAVEVAFLTGEKAGPGREAERVCGVVVQVRVGKSSDCWEKGSASPAHPLRPARLSSELSEPDLSLGHFHNSH